MFQPKPCKLCDSPYHQAFTCSQKPRPTLTTTKAMNKRGKQYHKWMNTRTSWIKAHKSETFRCHYCRRLLELDELTLDHMESRSRKPELRNELANLVPCCYTCNGLKGSRSHEEYPHSCDLI